MTGRELKKDMKKARENLRRSIKDLRRVRVLYWKNNLWEKKRPLLDDIRWRNERGNNETRGGRKNRVNTLLNFVSQQKDLI